MSVMDMRNARRRTIPAPRNPLDKCTVISIFPKPIREVKHTISPGMFEIQPGSYEKPAHLVVGTSSWWREVDDEQPLLEIPCSSIQVAESIVRDYCNGIVACNMGDKMPGLFYIMGEHSDMKALKKDYFTEFEKANTNQRNWYVALVRLADGLWARSNGNPLVISDEMRLAANELGYKDKTWNKDSLQLTLVNCVACGALRNPEFPICGSCHMIVDLEKAKALGIVAAPQPTQKQA
jgi:hypothetical protein